MPGREGPGARPAGDVRCQAGNLGRARPRGGCQALFPAVPGRSLLPGAGDDGRAGLFRVPEECPGTPGRSSSVEQRQLSPLESENGGGAGKPPRHVLSGGNTQGRSSEKQLRCTWPSEAERPVVSARVLAAGTCMHQCW